MKLNDLLQEFNDSAADAPTTAQIASSVSNLLAARRRNRRNLVVAACVAGVVVVAISASTIALSGRHVQSSGQSAEPSWNEGPAASIPPGSRLVAAHTDETISPISVPSITIASVSWLSSGSELDVWWGTPAGASPSNTSQSVPQGNLGAQGFTVTDSVTIESRSRPEAKPTAVLPTTTTSIVIAGHQATVSHYASVVSLGYGVQSDRTVSWRLANGKYIHLWKAGATQDQLVTLAGSLRETPWPLPQRMAFNLTLSGFADQTISSFSSGVSVQTATVTYCPSGISGGVYGYIHPSGCITASFENLSALGIGQLQENTTTEPHTISADGLQVQTYPGDNFAYAPAGKNSAITINSPQAPALTAEQLAALTASIKFDPDIAAH